MSIVQSRGYRLWGRLSRFRRAQLAVLFLVAGVACSVGLNARLPTAGHVLLWTLLLPFVAWLGRRDGQPFFGPVFFYDLVRSSHRGEQAGHRCLYAILLVCVLAGVYWSWFPHQGIEDLMHSRSMTLGQRARLANSFFTSFMTAQFAIVFLITPLYTASAIAEQKERRTLDFLLITDLSNREIILGMLGARLAKLLLLMMTGLPVLSLLEFLGGVDPGLVLAGFVATCMLMASLGSVSILASVHARTALSAVMVSYLVTLLLFVIAFLPFLGAAQASFVVANPPSAGKATLSPAGLSTSLIVFSVIHGVVAIVCCRIAIAQVRRAARAHAGGTGGTSGATNRLPAPRRTDLYRGAPSEVIYRVRVPYPAARDSVRDTQRWPDPYPPPRRTRPPVGADALLWKEIYAESTFGLAALRQLRFGPALGVLVLLVIVIACVNAPATRGSPGEYLQDWVRRLEIVLICVLLLIVALSASGRVSREREHRTLDNLLTLPMSSSAILFAKWVGSILSVGWLWCLLAPIWAIGAVTGGVNIFALPLLAVATAVYAGFVSSLGLWFSTVSGSTMRAGLFTLLAALLFLAVPGALTTAGNSSINLPTPEPFWSWRLVMEYGLSPPTTLWVLSFRTADLLGAEHLNTTARILAAVAGLQGYLAATALLWISTRARFARLSGSHDGSNHAAIDPQRRPLGG